MKMYVDELPKNCFECPCFRDDIDFPCGLSDGSKDYFLDEIDGGECPLKTLADYTKQVRKEVCWDIWKEFEQRLMGKKDDMAVMKVANMINSVLGKIGEKE